MSGLLYAFGAGLICGFAICLIFGWRYLSSMEKGDKYLLSDALIEVSFATVVCFTSLFCIVVLYFPEHMK